MRKNRNLYKNANINFLITFIKNHQSGKLNKIYQWWIYVLHNSVSHKVDDGFTFIWKRILCDIFLILRHVLSFGSSGLKCKSTHRKYGFLITSKMSLMSSGDMQISLWKSQSQNFTDFDIRTILLAQNSFDEWLAFCWVDYCVFQNYIGTLKHFVIVTWSWLFQFYSVQFFVMP